MRTNTCDTAACNGFVGVCSGFFDGVLAIFLMGCCAG